MKSQHSCTAPLHNAPCNGAQLRGRVAMQHQHCQQAGRVERGSAGVEISLTTKPQSVLWLFIEELRKFIMCKHQLWHYTNTQFRFHFSVTKVSTTGLLYTCKIHRRSLAGKVREGVKSKVIPSDFHPRFGGWIYGTMPLVIDMQYFQKKNAFRDQLGCTGSAGRSISNYSHARFYLVCVIIHYSTTKDFQSYINILWEHWNIFSWVLQDIYQLAWGEYFLLSIQLWIVLIETKILLSSNNGLRMLAEVKYTVNLMV